MTQNNSITDQDIMNNTTQLMLVDLDHRLRELESKIDRLIRSDKKPWEKPWEKANLQSYGDRDPSTGSHIGGGSQ